MCVYYEELFGLVVVVYCVCDEDEVVVLVNVLIYGLGGVVFSSDFDWVQWVVECFDIGMVWINYFMFFVVDLFFGGVKCLGFGCELFLMGMFEFINQKLVCVFLIK